MEKIFNWGTTVSKEELVRKINELANIVLDNTTKDNKLFTEIDKSSFYTKRFPDLFKLTVFNKDGKKYNPDDPNDRVFGISIKDINLETDEEGYVKYEINQSNIKHTPNEIDNRILNAYIISRIIVDTVNYCNAKYKFFVPKESDLYNACYTLVEFVLYLRLMDISPERQFSTLIYLIDAIDNDSINMFYTLAHRLGIPLYSGDSDIFLEQLHNSFYKVQSCCRIHSDEFNISVEKVHNDVICFELADIYSAPSDKYFMLGDKKISLTLDISTNQTLPSNSLFKKDMECLLDNSGLQCFKFTDDVRELYRDVGLYNIMAERITKYKNNSKYSVVKIFNYSLSDDDEYSICESSSSSLSLDYIHHTIIDGLLPRTIFKYTYESRDRIMVLPMLEAEFRHMVKNAMKGDEVDMEELNKDI